MDKVPYNDKLDADRQISMEEKIAGFLRDADQITDTSRESVEDEVLNQAGKDILYIVLQEFRSDLLEGKPVSSKLTFFASEADLRSMAHDVMHWEEKNEWPGSGEVPNWVRQMGEELGFKDIRNAIEFVTNKVKHEILRRFVCGA